MEAAVDPRTNAASDRYVRTAAAPRKTGRPFNNKSKCRVHKWDFCAVRTRARARGLARPLAISIRALRAANR